MIELIVVTPPAPGFESCFCQRKLPVARPTMERGLYIVKTLSIIHISLDRSVVHCRYSALSVSLCISRVQTPLPSFQQYPPVPDLKVALVPTQSRARIRVR